MTSQIPIFVINLEESRERYAAISDRLRGLGLEFERVPAIKGDEMTPAEKSEISPWRPWRYARTNAEIGCYESHLKALKIVAGRRLMRAIILEDDAVFDDDFPEFANPLYSLPCGADVLKLEGFNFSESACVPLGSTVSDRQIVFMTTPSFGAAAYLITLAGAEKALKRLTMMKDQLDSDLFRYWQTALDTYDVMPYPVRQEGVATTIPHRDTKKLSAWEKFTLNIFRVPVKRHDRAKRKREMARRLAKLPVRSEASEDIGRLLPPNFSASG